MILLTKTKYLQIVGLVDSRGCLCSLLYQLKQFERALHDGIAEHIDAQGDGGGAIGLAVDVAFDAGHAACLDADLTAYLQPRGIDGDGGLGIAYHTHEVLHLGVGYAGEVGPSKAIFAGAIHQEVKDELGFAGYLVTVGLGAADKEVAGAEDFIDLLALACAGPDAHLLLYGNIDLGPCFGFEGLRGVFMKLSQQCFELFLVGFLGIGRDYGDEPAVVCGTDLS